MLVRFRQDVIDLHPKVVIILAGTNDIAGNTGPMRLEDIEANYASMAELARAHDIKVIYSSVLPVHNYTPRSQDLFAQRSPEKILELNRWLKSYCSTSSNDKSNACLYLDYFSAMVDDKGYLRKELADDGLHPNAAGLRSWRRWPRRRSKRCWAQRNLETFALSPSSIMKQVSDRPGLRAYPGRGGAGRSRADKACTELVKGVSAPHFPEGASGNAGASRAP